MRPMPSAEALFSTYLLPLYRVPVETARATDANPGNNASVLGELADTARVFVAMHASVFDRDLALDWSDASVHRLGAALTRDVRDRLARSGAPGTPDNALFNVIAHGAAYVGECVVRAHGGTWLVRNPLWESRVRLRSRAGDAELAPLSWWLRALGDDAFDDEGRPRAGLAERYRAHVEVPAADPESLPVLAPPRALPRLKRPRYDVFYKYLVAHLPEVRDVGADFPSPERFEGYGFAWLDFVLVGGGRMLVVAGPGAGGLHAFWLDRGGFVKSALFAADAMPEPIVRAEGEKIVFVVAHEGKTVSHETMWWGP